ncbi:DNA mismatch repair protein MutS [Roseomonas mucosa]|uniref:DNA mismatch repair protein MutS n=1 Tax=Roseomonas mucosa TaxID=207340 RepID=UPI0028CEC7FC|nr:DNA mismatch repair protein MutS [Roseomonas mucosa]MDT8278422.1 DNA mismatch repair protein MutS [Roseomonas mucosa]
MPRSSQTASVHAPDADGSAPPSPTGGLIASYAAIRAAVSGYLLLYRVGEFYEVLAEDAAIISQALGIQLTRRRQKDAPDVPMCGIPASTLDVAAGRLLAAGHKVALSEQPPAPGEERPLRLLTPGTSVDATVLAAERPNNLTVAFTAGEAIGFAWLDVSTGESGTSMASLGGCGPALARVAPVEVLVARWPDKSDALAVALRSSGVRFSDLDRPELTEGEAQAILAAAYGADSREALRGFSPPELTALAALLDYVRATVGRLPDALLPPRRAPIGDTMEIDAPTLRGLEVLSSGAGQEGSLLSVLDRTVTPAGARLLTRQLAAPLTSPETIRRRLAMVRFLVENPQLRGGCREELSGMPDVLRACGRLSLGKAGPRDLATVRDALARAQAIAAQLQGAADLPSGLATAGREMTTAGDPSRGGLATTLRRALVLSPPLSASEGGFIAEGYHSELNSSRAEAAAAQEALGKLQVRYIQQTGVKTLRIKANTLLGHHIEVPTSGVKALGPEFTLRQGLASSARYTTPDLDRLASEREAAVGRATGIEERLFRELATAILSERPALTRIAHAAAALDLVCGLAQAAAEGLWSEPELSDDALLEIEGGRHPVAEVLLEAQARSFVPNDCRVGGDQRLWLLTGPNMAGKSTFLRQVALIVLMAQIGSFVPAKRARVGVVDKMFSRIGASDDLAAGRSTFMVEMLETSAILNQATARSLVILDEVGRGTSTHDGLAIAQACMEYLHDTVGCRTLFATHFHELADAAEAMPHAVCMAMDAAAGRHDEMFAYKVKPGRAGRSYGLQVAARAGMPETVLKRATELLSQHGEAHS